MPALVAARYRLGESVGRGGMGRVWRAHDQILDRDVAVKEIVPPPGLSDPEAVHRRTLREARATARLSHPGVVQVFDVLEVDGGTWIVMEYVPSRSLQEVLKAEGPLPPRRVAKIGLDLLDALVAANRAGVEHRDVKPANVLIADDGRVMLTDFGIAAIADDPSNSMSDALIGSPEYMPPERAKNEHAGLVSDLWSLGATLYAAVEGKSPFRRPTVAATLTAITVSPPDPPTQAGALAPLLEALLQKDPADRPSAKDAATMLRSAASGAYGRASIPAPDVREGTAPAEPPAVDDPSTPVAPPENAAPTPAPSEAPTPAPSEDPAPAPVENPALVSPAVPGPAQVEDLAPAPSEAPALAEVPAPAPVEDSAVVSPAVPGPAQVEDLAPAPSEDPAPASVENSALVSPAVPTPAPVEDPALVSPAVPAPVEDFAPVPAEEQPALARNRRRWVTIAAAVLSVLLIAGAALWFADHRSAGRSTSTEPSRPPSTGPSSSAAAAPPASASASTSASAPSSSSSSAPASSSSSTATSGRPALPGGWHDYHDKTGFSVYVPDGWSKSQKNSMVYFRGDGRVLGIDQSDQPKSDPLADWREKSSYRVSNGDFPGYHLVRLESVKYLKKSADWEYTFNGSGTRQHVDNRNILASSHQAYAIYWQTADADWNAHKEDLALIYASFRPK
jgi:eukaryotic-like serine/threonine-protein kinase